VGNNLQFQTNASNNQFPLSNNQIYSPNNQLHSPNNQLHSPNNQISNPLNSQFNNQMGIGIKSKNDNEMVEEFQQSLPSFFNHHMQILSKQNKIQKGSV